MKRFIAIIGAAVLLASTATLAAEPIAAKAESGGGTALAATLAPYGSFEFVAAPSYTKLATARTSAAAALRKRQITVAEAQTFQKRADEVRSLLDQALKVCAQDNKSGVCKGNARKANVLLTDANAKLAAL